MDQRTRTQMQKLMFLPDIDKLKQVIISYYQTHRRERIQYSKDRYKLMNSREAMQLEWDLDDIIVMCLLENKMRNKVNWK